MKLSLLTLYLRTVIVSKAVFFVLTPHLEQYGVTQSNWSQGYLVIEKCSESSYSPHWFLQSTGWWSNNLPESTERLTQKVLRGRKDRKNKEVKYCYYHWNSCKWKDPWIWSCQRSFLIHSPLERARHLANESPPNYDKWCFSLYNLFG